MIGSTNNSITENYLLEELRRLQIYVEDLRDCENHRQENDRIAQRNFHFLNKRVQHLEEENKNLREDNEVLLKQSMNITETVLKTIEETKKTLQSHLDRIDNLEKSFSKLKI